MSVTTITDAQLAPKDYASDQEVRWCPGCGDYAILKAVQKACADMGLQRERTVFVSGIGCAARFPYYLATYGFHTIHGRAPTIATGIKLANPELDVWVITGDGDGLSIGGNHMLHVLRRNVDLQILLFNNEIYGLTKGQDSPTPRRGTRSPSAPQGPVEKPRPPGTLALEVVPVGKGGVALEEILVHDETNRTLAQLLVGLEPPEFPMALGVLYCAPATSYEADVYAQARAAGFGGKRELADIGTLLSRDGTWTVE